MASVETGPALSHIVLLVYKNSQSTIRLDYIGVIIVLYKYFTII